MRILSSPPERRSAGTVHIHLGIPMLDEILLEVASCNRLLMIAQLHMLQG